MSKVLLKREKKKSQILGAAVQLFTEKGFENVTLRDIADRLKMGRTTVYEYFKNKNEILAAYLVQEMDVFYNKIMSAIAKDTTFKNKLREILAISLDYANQHHGFQQLFRSLATSSDEISLKISTGIRKQHQSLFHEFAGEINRAVKNKEIKNVSADILVQVIFNMTALPVRSNKNVLQTADEIMNYFWSGIAGN